MRIINSIYNRISNITNKDKLSWINKNRDVHLRFRRYLDSKYLLNVESEKMGNYMIPKLVKPILKKYPIVISGGVEFHIDFELSLNKALPVNIHFFEVDEQSVQWFNKNYGDFDNFIINHNGLSSKSEILNVYGDSERAWSSCIDPNLISHSNRKWRVLEKIETTTISDYCSKHNINDIGLLKLDIEGYAPKVIYSTWESGIQPKILVFEIERGDNENIFDYIDRVFNLLNEAKKNSYRIYNIPRLDGYSSFSTDFVLIKDI